MKKISSKPTHIEREHSQKLLYFNDITSNILAEFILECAQAQLVQEYKGSREITSIGNVKICAVEKSPKSEIYAISNLFF